jgi:uncharacterized protein YPO0396
MTRSIQLTQIHALCWYGYEDSIPVQGNLLLAGVTGSGKSALMDLIQFVLIGDQRLISFNKSATGDRSDRTLKGYCLGDTKEEENGTVQYMRNSARTYVALEFTWPKGKKQEAKQETWGIRVEFTSTVEQNPRITAFFVPSRLQRSDFLDKDKYPLDVSLFRAMVESRGGRIYSDSLEPYLRDMAQPPHLNFDRDVLRRLLPTAMSFTFLRSFNDFCRQFILPSDRLDVSNVTASYRTFRAYENDLKNLDDQFRLLAEIAEVFGRLTDLRRDKALARYLQSEFYLDHTADLLSAAEDKFGTMKDLHADEETRIGELDRSIPELERQIRSNSTAINATPEGQLYMELVGRQDDLNRAIGRLIEIGNTLQSALGDRLRRARAWINEVKQLTLSYDGSVVTAVENAINTAEERGINDLDSSLNAVSQTARTALTEALNAARPILAKLADARKRAATLRTEIAALQIGKLPFPTRLLDALSNQLPQSLSEPAAQHLRELCEVTDERWRPAVEIAFTRKFAVVVPSELYDSAEKIYSKMTVADLGEQLGRESLVNSFKAIKLRGAIRPGSLAEKVQTNHPIAAAIVRHQLGNLVCVEQIEDLRNHDFAIMPDGFMTRGPFLERRQFYNGLPFVGQRGLAQQLAHKQGLLSATEVDEQQFAPIESALKGLQERWEERFGLSASIYGDLARAKDLPNLQAELADVRMRLDRIDRSAFEELARDQAIKEAALKTLKSEHRTLLSKSHREELKRCEEAVNGLQREHGQMKDRFDRVRNEVDISQWLKPLAELRTSMLELYPVKSIAGDRCGERFNQCNVDQAASWERLKAVRKELAIKYTKFEDLDIADESNAAYAKQLKKLEESEIPDYKAKASIERARWENLFRTQVLEKLHSALREVVNQVYLLNSALKQQPIGKDRYQLRYRNNPDFKIYHDLLEVSALAREDELFFSSAEPQFRETIQRFLETLTERPDSSEASRLLDYRYYYEFDMEVVDADGRKMSVDRQSGKFSGGENQSPYFIAILASYLRAYRRYSTRRADATLALVPIDEAFSKLSGERIKDCISALRAFDLQGVFSMSTGNIPYALDHCDWLVAVSKKEVRAGKRLKISNIPVSIGAESEDAKELVQF